MKKSLLMLCGTAIVAFSLLLISFTRPVKHAAVTSFQTTGTLYVKISSDGNKGNIHVTARSETSLNKLFDVQIAPGQTFEKTITGLPNGPRDWYVVSFQWPHGEYHNLASGGSGHIGWGVPVMDFNVVRGWQIGGWGAFGSVPLKLH